MSDPLELEELNIFLGGNQSGLVGAVALKGDVVPIEWTFFFSAAKCNDRDRQDNNTKRGWLIDSSDPKI